MTTSPEVTKRFPFTTSEALMKRKPKPDLALSILDRLNQMHGACHDKATDAKVHELRLAAVGVLIGSLK